MTNLSRTFNKKITYLIEFFNKQCYSLQNNSTLPKFNTYHTESKLNYIIFDNKKLLKIDYELIIKNH